MAVVTAELFFKFRNPAVEVGFVGCFVIRDFVAIL